MKLFKKLAAAGVCTVMAAGMYAPAAFAAEKANVQLNGTVLENVQAERDYDCVYMPFRTLLEGLNAEAEYNAIKKTVTASHNGFTAVFDTAKSATLQAVKRSPVQGQRITASFAK